MNDFLVSVCVLTYNHEDYIEESLNSILNQEVDFKVEVVIFDDFSTDNTRLKLIKYQLNIYDNFTIKIFSNKENIGVAQNFKLGLEACNGKYIALCDGDDIWNDTTKLKHQVSFLESNDKYIASFHDSNFIGKFGNELYGTFLNHNSKKDLNKYDFLSGNHTIPTQTVMVKKEFEFLPIEFEIIPNPDIFFFAFLSKYGDFYYDRKIGNSSYRLHSGGYFSTQNRFSQSFGNLRTFLVLMKLFPKENILKENVLIKMFTCVIYGIKEKKIFISIKIFFKFIFFEPYNSIIWKCKVQYPVYVAKKYLLK